LVNSRGFILQDWTGRALRVRVTFYGSIRILVAESRALQDGLDVAIPAYFHNPIIKGDNKTVIQLLEGAI